MAEKAIQKPVDKLREEMTNPESDLRNQKTSENVMDYQLLNNTPVAIIAAMTGKDAEEVTKRAVELGLVPRATAGHDREI